MDRAVESGERRGANILIVDDEGGIRNLLQRVLDGGGHRVISASDGPEALQHCRQGNRPIDLVISDVVMPNMSGPDMAREIQTLHPGIKVIFVSGYHTGFDALPEGAVLLTKPFGPKDILNAVNDLLTRQ